MGDFQELTDLLLKVKSSLNSRLFETNIYEVSPEARQIITSNVESIIIHEYNILNTSKTNSSNDYDKKSYDLKNPSITYETVISSFWGCVNNQTLEEISNKLNGLCSEKDANSKKIALLRYITLIKSKKPEITEKQEHDINYLCGVVNNSPEDFINNYSSYVLELKKSFNILPVNEVIDRMKKVVDFSIHQAEIEGYGSCNKVEIRGEIIESLFPLTLGISNIIDEESVNQVKLKFYEKNLEIESPK